MIVNFIRSYLVDENLQEAKAGKLEYRAMEGSMLVLDGEILIASEEVQDLEQEFGIEKPDLPIGQPFQSWEELIDVVKAKSPDAKRIIRYLEDFGYQDILKIKNDQTMPDGTIQIRWDNFLLSKDQAQQDGYKDGADYNRRMFKELQKYAPRAQIPEVFGGRKLMRGAVGSQRELKKRREPMVDYIIEESKPDVIEATKRIFGVLPDDWAASLIGTNGERISYAKDPTAIHLGKSIENAGTAEQYQEITRWDRVLKTLLIRSRGGGDEYKQAIQDVEAKLDDLKKNSKRYEIVYVIVAVQMARFYKKLATELKTVGYKEASAGSAEEDEMVGQELQKMFGEAVESDGLNQYVANSTLHNVPRFISLLDPSKAQQSWESYGGQFGLRSDFYDVIQGAVLRAFGSDVQKVNRVSKYGHIFFTKYEREREDADMEKGDYGENLRAVANAYPDSYEGQQAAKLLGKQQKQKRKEERKQRRKTDVDDIADSIEN